MRSPSRPLSAAFVALTATFLATACAPDTEAGATPQASAAPGPEFGIVIHGGAGTITRESMTDELEASYHAALDSALAVGHGILEQGGTALDAVVAAVRILEDEPLFNAGRGAVFTSDGTNELDAAIMDGATLNAGAVAGVKSVKNPITLARLVMEESPHVFMVGEGAETFGAQHGVETVDASWFHTEQRWEALQRARESEGTDVSWHLEENRMIGTVGAVARDRNGDLAAATSTGGMTNKRFGRVGDVPVIGAGTYASNASCAVSATGHGEYFIRTVVAREICARMEYLGESLQAASEAVINDRLGVLGGTGGVVAIDRDGHPALYMNTPGMYRGHWMAGGRPFTAIYGDEGDGR
ncbi:MAG: isoaspartyl peptidase/L-asparaginase [Gemmatimonadales bacterium]|nr:MAG: isoaspartyl peptidase/L-asparaginase [Gemmatimonadales bacterium]